MALENFISIDETEEPTPKQKVDEQNNESPKTGSEQNFEPPVTGSLPPLDPDLAKMKYWWENRGYTVERGRTWISRDPETGKWLLMDPKTGDWIVDDAQQEKIESLLERGPDGEPVLDDTFSAEENALNPRFKVKETIDTESLFAWLPTNNWPQVQITKTKAVVHGLKETKEFDIELLKIAQNLIDHANENWKGKAIRVNGTEQFKQAVWAAAEMMNRQALANGREPIIRITNYTPPDHLKGKILNDFENTLNSESKKADQERKAAEEKKKEEEKETPKEEEKETPKEEKTEEEKKETPKEEKTEEEKKETPKKSEEEVARERFRKTGYGYDPDAKQKNEEKKAAEQRFNKSGYGYNPNAKEPPKEYGRTYGSRETQQEKDAKALREQEAARKAEEARKTAADQKTKSEQETAKERFQKTGYGYDPDAKQKNEEKKAAEQRFNKSGYGYNPNAKEPPKEYGRTYGSRETQQEKDAKARREQEAARKAEEASKAAVDQKTKSEKEVAKERFQKTGYGYDPDAKQKNEEKKATEQRFNKSGYGYDPNAKNKKPPKEYGTTYGSRETQQEKDAKALREQQATRKAEEASKTAVDQKTKPEQQTAQTRFQKSGYGYNPSAKQKNEEKKAAEQRFNKSGYGYKPDAKTSTPYGSQPEKKWGKTYGSGLKTSTDYSVIAPKKKVEAEKVEKKVEAPLPKAASKGDHGKLATTHITPASDLSRKRNPAAAKVKIKPNNGL